MYKFASLYHVEDPDPNLTTPNRVFSGLGAGLATFGGMHLARKGLPWMQEKIVRGIGGQKIFRNPHGYQATWTRGGLNKVLGNKYTGMAALTLPFLYNMFLRKE